MACLNRVTDHPNITVGDFTYANDFDPPADRAARLAPHLYPSAPKRLHIGRFCQIVHGLRFITASANHDMAGLTTYPVPVFDPSRIKACKDGFTGHDVWIGHGALILPGARRGTG